jgi:peptidoglycan-associated lipoprotein
MSAATMHRRRFRGSDPRRKAIGWGVVAAVHAVIGWALVTGTARKGFEILKKPMEAAVIQEVIIPPPPPPPPPPPTTSKGSIVDRMAAELQDVYFDYDKSDIRGDAQSVLTTDATALKSILADFPGAAIVIEGHCDERGSAEYNLGLGDRRATAARDFLQQMGVPADRLKTISYGKERPQCTESNESCWQKNRRVHLSAGQ